jgi:ABC-type Na+ transport system ATPase subunit NatA
VYADLTVRENLEYFAAVLGTVVVSLALGAATLRRRTP